MLVHEHRIPSNLTKDAMINRLALPTLLALALGPTCGGTAEEPTPQLLPG